MHLVKDHHEHQVRRESELAHTEIGPPQCGQVELEDRGPDPARQIILVEAPVDVLPGR